MFNMGMSEMLIIGAIALIVIGPARLPQLARSLGKGMTAFKRASNEFKRNLSEEMDAHVGPDVQELAKFAKTVKDGVKNPGDIASALETAADVLEKGQKDVKKALDAPEPHDPVPDFVRERIAAQKANKDLKAEEATDAAQDQAPEQEAEAQAILKEAEAEEETSEQTNTKNSMKKS